MLCQGGITLGKHHVGLAERSIVLRQRRIGMGKFLVVLGKQCILLPKHLNFFFELPNHGVIIVNFNHQLFEILL